MDDLGVEWWVAGSHMEFTGAPVEDEEDDRCGPESYEMDKDG
jgi:hypothetical protein